eukprot:2539436-Prymnesium_polylepis.1
MCQDACRRRRSTQPANAIVLPPGASDVTGVCTPVTRSARSCASMAAVAADVSCRCASSSASASTKRASRFLALARASELVSLS